MKRIILVLLNLAILLTGRETGARYLIIAHDDYFDAALPLARWKYRKGMKSKIVSLSDIGSDSILIRDYIVNAYTSWDIRPEYLLFVGAPSFIPFPKVNGVYSDNYYANVTGDMRNDILCGRLTVHYDAEAQTVINKILTYERTPFTEDSLWFNKGCLIIKHDYDNDDSIYWSDLHYAAELMTSANFVEIDTFSDSLGDNKDSILNAVNDGRSIVLFRGSAFNNWPPPFDVYPDQAQNGAKLPIVLSVTCQTMGTGATSAIAERWLLTGTPTTPRGAAGFFATTTAINEQAYLRSAVAKGFFNALFNQNARTFGAACEGARTMVYTMYQYHGGINEYLGYATLGDPEMNLWTDTPCSLTCTHPVTISVGSVACTVNVAGADDLSPVSGALVCIAGRTDSTVYAIDTTDGNGDAHIDVEPHFTGDTLYVTVTGVNLQPYEGTIVTSVSGVHVIYLSSSVDDSPGGNGDGIVNPGETVNLPLWIKNHGDRVGYDVHGTLQTTDDYITINDSVKSFGDIDAGDSAFTGTNGYSFSVLQTCPDGHATEFALACRDSADSVWLSHFSLQVSAAELLFQNATISGGNGNNTVEPGETVSVCVTIQNQGSTAADSVIAVLQSLSPYMTVVDSTGLFEHIGPDSSSGNEFDPFVVYSDSTTPEGTFVDFRMITFTDLCIDTLMFTLIVGRKDYYVWNPDPTPESGINIDNILTSLGYNGVYDTCLVPDLRPYKYVFACMGVFPNNYVIHENSPEAVAISCHLQNGGCVCLEGGDIWYFDPLGSGHDFGPLFGIAGIDDGADDAGPFEGQPGRFTENMAFAYSGENRFIDRIDTLGGNSFLIFKDADNGYGCAVAHDAIQYRTVGLSFELGMLSDSTPPSTRSALLDSIMRFFEHTPCIMETQSTYRTSVVYLNVYPNPSRNIVHILYNTAGRGQTITLKLYDVLGRCVKTFIDDPEPHFQEGNIYWNRTDDCGKKVAAGVYFVRLENLEHEEKAKVVLLP